MTPLSSKRAPWRLCQARLQRAPRVVLLAQCTCPMTQLEPQLVQLTIISCALGNRPCSSVHFHACAIACAQEHHRRRRAQERGHVVAGARSAVRCCVGSVALHTVSKLTELPVGGPHGSRASRMHGRLDPLLRVCAAWLFVWLLRRPPGPRHVRGRVDDGALHPRTRSDQVHGFGAVRDASADPTVIPDQQREFTGT